MRLLKNLKRREKGRESLMARQSDSVYTAGISLAKVKSALKSSNSRGAPR